MKTLVTSRVVTIQHTQAQERGTLASNVSLLTLFQALFGLPIDFSASAEGSVIEMKPNAPFPARG